MDKATKKTNKTVLCKKYVIVYDKKLNELLYMVSGHMIGIKTAKYHAMGGHHKHIKIDLNDTDRYIYFESDTIDIKHYSRHEQKEVWVDKTLEEQK